MPYLRGRLAFAQIAAEALASGTFEAIRVDLPAFWNRTECVETPLELFPYVTSLVIQVGGDFYSQVFAPNDAAFLAMALAARRGLDWRCVDDEDRLNYPEGGLFRPALDPVDDEFVFWEGVERFFAPLWERMDRDWPAAPIMQQALTLRRASVVVEGLQPILASGRKALFVCECRLWWAVRGILQGTLSTPRQGASVLPFQDVRAAFVREDPYRVWALGLLDDYPCLTHRFGKQVQEGRADFHKLGALDDEMARFWQERGSEFPQSSSIRRMRGFDRYLRTRLAAGRRLTPLPASHLFAGARSFYGEDFAKALASRLLAYPAPVTEKHWRQPTFVVLGANGIIPGGEGFRIPELSETRLYDGGILDPANEWGHGFEREQRRDWADRVHPYLTRAERVWLGRAPVTRWAVEPDYRLHFVACSLLRDRTERHLRRERVVRSWGSTGDGIHWKATIAALGRGERTVYVRQRAYRREQSLGIDEHTPIVLLLSEEIAGNRLSAVHDSNYPQRMAELGETYTPNARNTKPDFVYSLLASRTQREYYLEGHARRDEITAIGFLYTNFLMGVARYEAINRRPPRFQCRTDPDDDPGLQPFSLHERIVAWAIRYAEKVAIVAAYAGWEPSGNLRSFAADWGVRLVVLPLFVFSPDLVKRLQSMYFISTPLKKHPDREAILRRILR